MRILGCRIKPRHLMNLTKMKGPNSSADSIMVLRVFRLQDLSSLLMLMPPEPLKAKALCRG
jgi:hypothetical protein